MLFSLHFKQITMKNLFKIISILLMILVTFSIKSAPLGLLTLQDGSLIKINDDFTWEYANEEFRAPGNSKAENPPPPISPLSTDLTTLESEETSLNIPHTPAISNSADKNGINIKFVSSQWDTDRVGLTFELTSHSEESYVIISLEINLISDKDKLIKNTTINVWQASYRLPETYLRNKQIRESRIIWIDGIDKTQWNNESMNLNIKEMKSRG